MSILMSDSDTSPHFLEDFHRILAAAVQSGASDIHLKGDSPVRFRVHRDLVEVDCPQPTDEWISALGERIASPLARQRFAEQGEADFAYEHTGVGRHRVNFFLQRGRPVLALRIVKATIPTFSGLNLPPVTKELAERSHGLILVAGATGNGKSTTLAAMVEHINAHFRKHIITLEDPIEYIFSDKLSVVEQREIGLDTMSFAAGLKHVLRQDPDVIMIGEMRDAESFQAAMRAVNTGHLVISTLHSSRASQAITRVLEFFDTAEHEQVRRQLAAGLSAVLCQQLLTDSKEQMRPVVEVLVNNETVRGTIESGKLETLSAAMERGQSVGMQTFNQALLDMIKQGTISQEAAMKHSPNPEALRMNFKGIFSATVG
jgi:pilus retraction protein PilT